jgi:catechol 2,3-dioxygenase-like lactoylglutathione lyase family enzyme
MVVKLRGLDHVAIAVNDVEKSAQWYVDVLGFERQHPGMWGGRPVFVGNEHGSVAIFPKRRDAYRKGTILHFAFRTSRDDFEAARRELRNRGIGFEFQDHEITHSIYFKDPDGHEIEVTTYDICRGSCKLPAGRQRLPLHLRDSSAAVLKFFPTAARAGLVAPDFRRLPAHRRKIQLHFAFAVAIRRDRSVRSDRLHLPTGQWTIGGWRSRHRFAQQKLRQR